MRLLTRLVRTSFVFNMATEVINNVPENTEKEKEAKEDAPVDNGQNKEDPPAEKVEEKTEEKKVEPAPPKITVHKANFEKDVVYLYQFSRTPLLPSTSPYCLKVETWLRLAGIKYEVSVKYNCFYHFYNITHCLRFPILCSRSVKLLPTYCKKGTILATLFHESNMIILFKM